MRDITFCLHYPTRTGNQAILEGQQTLRLSVEGTIERVQEKRFFVIVEQKGHPRPTPVFRLGTR